MSACFRGVLLAGVATEGLEERGAGSLGAKSWSGSERIASMIAVPAAVAAGSVARKPKAKVRSGWNFVMDFCGRNLCNVLHFWTDMAVGGQFQA
jgi:hypothetical protein